MRTPIDYIQGIMHPEAFHGRGKTNGFFEGWYIKLVSKDLNHRWAIIPGIFRARKSDRASSKSQAGFNRNEAFVQVLDGMTGKSWYHVFPAEEFSAGTKEFSVRVADNYFSAEGISLNLPDLKGDIQFTSAMDPWPVTFTSPGIMGWYGLVPFMECFHGVVSFGHDLEGSLEIHGDQISFNSGRGYIEKDWGKAFPSGYVWLHSNHFESNPEAAFIGSVAIIPWLGSAFRGYIVGLKHGGRLYKWTTYNSTKEQRLKIDDASISWQLKGPDGVLEVFSKRTRGGLLHAPFRESMHQRVEETLDAKIQLRHISTSGQIVFEDVGMVGAMEVFGDLEKLRSLRN